MLAFASIAVAALAAPLLFAACAHQPREFDVSGPAPAEERLAPPDPVAANLTGAWELNLRESDQPSAYRGGGEGGMGGGRRGSMGGMGGGRRPGFGGTPGGTGGGDYPGSAGMPPRPGGYGGGGSGGRSGAGGPGFVSSRCG